jgi:hypothetical protein
MEGIEPSPLQVEDQWDLSEIEQLLKRHRGAPRRMGENQLAFNQLDIGFQPGCAMG